MCNKSTQADYFKNHKNKRVDDYRSGHLRELNDGASRWWIVVRLEAEGCERKPQGRKDLVGERVLKSLFLKIKKFLKKKSLFCVTEASRDFRIRISLLKEVIIFY
jgi:hypothetical protein